MRERARRQPSARSGRPPVSASLVALCNRPDLLGESIDCQRTTLSCAADDATNGTGLQRRRGDNGAARLRIDELAKDTLSESDWNWNRGAAPLEKDHREIAGTQHRRPRKHVEQASGLSAGQSHDHSIAEVALQIAQRLQRHEALDASSICGPAPLNAAHARVDHGGCCFDKLLESERS